jgi:Tol biopolymer transport system component
VNSAGWDFGPRFSPDGRTFYFTSNRSDWPASRPRPLSAQELERALSSPGNGLRDVYQVPAAALDLKSPCPEAR